VVQKVEGERGKMNERKNGRGSRTVVTRSMVAWKRSFCSALLFFKYCFAVLSREIICEPKNPPPSK
jgi:hypothetical protein